MKKVTTYFLSSFFIFVLIFLSIISSSAFEIDKEKATYTSYYIYNYENNYTIVSENIREKVSPSAFVKSFAISIILEQNPNFDTIITIDKQLLNGTSGRFMGLKAGETVCIKDLVNASILAGYNDATVVLANYIFGNVDTLVEKMNQKAVELSMNDSHFTNCTGIDDTNMYTTAHDMILFANYIKNNETYMSICSQKEYTMSASSTTSLEKIYNRNNLPKKFRNIKAISTSSADYGDSNILYYERDGLSYLCVVVNAKAKSSDDAENYAETLSSSLILHAVNNYGYKNLVSSKNYLFVESVKYCFDTDEVKLYSSTDITAYLPLSTTEDEIKLTYFLTEKELKAPLKSGDVVGKLIVAYNGEIIESTDLIVKKDIEAHGFLVFLDGMRNYILSRYFGLAVVLMTLALAFYILYQKGYVKIGYKKPKSK